MSTGAPTKNDTSPYKVECYFVPNELDLQHVVSEWEDKYQNSRCHVVMVLPSGMHLGDLLGGSFNDDNSEVFVDMLLPSDCSDVRRILSHARYNNHYHDGHPKWIALQKSINENMHKGSHRFKVRVRIKLPSSGYQFTDEDVSGHGSCEMFEHKVFKTDDDGHEVLDETGSPIEVPAKATLFCLLDLVIPSEGLKAGGEPILEDDFDIDDC